MPTMRIRQITPSAGAGARSGPPVYRPGQTPIAQAAHIGLNRNPVAPPVYKPQPINSSRNFSPLPQSVRAPAVQCSVPQLPAGAAGNMRTRETGRPSWAPAAGTAAPQNRVKTPEEVTGVFARVAPTQSMSRRPVAPPVYRPNYGAVAPAYVVPGSRPGLSLKAAGPILQRTIFPAALQMMEDKKKKQQEEKDRKKRQEQSRVDRSANAVRSYGDQGRVEAVVDLAKEDARKGFLVAHRLGNSNSNTSGKFQTWSKDAKARASDSTAKVSNADSDKPKGGYYPPKQKAEKTPFPKQDLDKVRKVAGDQRSREKFLEAYRREFRTRTALLPYANKMETWAEKAADEIFGEEDFSVLSEHPSTAPTFRDKDDDSGGPGSGNFGGLGLPVSTTSVDVK